MLLPPGWRASYDWLIHICGRFLHAKLTTGIGPFSSLAAAVRQLGTDREAKRVSNSLRICCGAWVSYWPISSFGSAQRYVYDWG